MAITIFVFSAVIAQMPVHENTDYSTERPEFENGWFLVRLVEPIAERLPGGSFALRTGSLAVDALIDETGVHRIEYALPSSAESPRFREAFRRHGLDRTYRFHVPWGTDVRALVERFERLPGVDYAEPDYLVHAQAVFPDDPLFPDQWGFDQPSDADVDGPEAWMITTGVGVVVAMSDSGIDSDHEDLAGPRILQGTDLVNMDSDPEDDRGHGTGTTSVAMANTDNSLGMAGTCWNCAILPVKVLNENGQGNHSRTADGFVWATDNGARIINHSAGSASGSQTLLDGVLYAYDAGVLIVTGVGNGNQAGITFPAAYAETVAVGGTDRNDGRYSPLDCGLSLNGSNWGPEMDVVAPAVDVVRADLGGGYSTSCGNSFSGPRVSGLLGLVQSLNPAAGREEMRHLLHAGGEDEVGDPSEDTPGFDEFYGWGRLNMERALQATESSVSLRVEGKTSTRVFLETANPLASSYDFIRGDLGPLSETAAGVDIGTALCLENNSPDPDTLGNEDNAIPPAGLAFYYLGRFNAAPGAGSYGGSSRNRDRIPSAGDCAG